MSHLARAVSYGLDSMEGCCVCADDTGTEDNPLVYCDGQGCNVCVHKACYGIRAIPNGDWFCSKCAYLRNTSTGSSGSSNGEAGSRVVNCELCPSKEGAFKPTTTGKWAHVICALYIREATFVDTEVMEPIVTTTLPKEIFQRTCCICLEESSENDATTGASAVCEKNGCRKAFHVTCAQKKGLLCEINKKNNKLQVVYSGFCGEHIPSAESGLVDGHRYRKIPAYPRIAGAGCERASSSSGYSTPNNPEKSPRPPPSSQDPASSQSVATVENNASNTSVDNLRSSSIKSTASVGSSGTTESADSGIQTTVSEALVQPVVVEEKQAIRKPHKKSLSARMDNAGITPNPVASPAVPSPSQPPPMTFPYGPMIQQAPPMPADGGRYHVGNPFADMPGQYDLSRSQMLVAPGLSKPPEMMQHVKMMATGTPPPLMANVPLQRKRPLSPSILDSETLTISSLIERTIERATTSTTTLPPVVMPFTTGVRPPFMPEDKGPAPSPGESGQRKPKKAAKESKADPRRASNTATIKDLLANTNLSPAGQQGGHPSPQSEMFMQQQQQQMMQQAMSQKMGMHPTPPPSRGGPGDVERGSHGTSSPFPRAEKPVSPKMINVARVHDDRHRNALEKVQHYLTNQSGPELSAMNNQPIPLTTQQQGPASAGSKSKRKAQDERTSRAGQPTKTNPNQSEEPNPSPSTAKPESGRKSNGYVNGAAPPNAPPVTDEEMDGTGAQAFDTLMMALSTFGTTAAHQTGAAIHPTVATTLDGFFRMQKELNVLKEKVGQLEGLKAFYLTQVQALRSLTEKHAAAEGGLGFVQPSIPEEVARLLSVLEPHDEAASTAQRRGPPPPENASDGLLARLHEPAGRDATHRSSRDTSRPESRAQTAPSSSLPPAPSSVQSYNHPPAAHLQTTSPSHTPKPYPRSRPNEREQREREKEREGNSYVMTNGYPPQSSSSSNRRGHYAHLEGMDGIPSGVISTPAPVTSQPQLLMPSMAGAQFLMPNQQFYQMQMDPQRMMAMLPGQAFFPPGLYGGPGMGGFIPAQNVADYAGLGRMHTPTTRYPTEDSSHSSGSQHPHNSMKREYDTREAS